MSYFDKEIISKNIILERLTVHSKRISLDSYARTMYNTARIIEDFDYRLGRAVMLLADMAKGDTITATMVAKKEVEIEIFNTWWDHLKYDLKEDRFKFKLPKWIKNKLIVKYIKQVKKVEVIHPVSILRACPHANINFEDKPYIHLQFIAPLKYPFGEEI